MSSTAGKLSQLSQERQKQFSSPTLTEEGLISLMDQFVQWAQFHFFAFAFNIILLLWDQPSSHWTLYARWFSVNIVDVLVLVILTELFPRDVKDGVHKDKGWSNSGESQCCTSSWHFHSTLILICYFIVEPNSMYRAWHWHLPNHHWKVKLVQWKAKKVNWPKILAQSGKWLSSVWKIVVSDRKLNCAKGCY